MASRPGAAGRKRGGRQDEASLVAGAREGEEAAIRTLIRNNNQRLFRVARAVLRDDAEAEDVVQETYLRAFSRLESFEGRSAFSTWLTRIALNDALGRRRKRRPMDDIETIEVSGMTAELIPFPGAAVPASPETETGRAEMKALLEEVVDQLPEPFRLVLVLRDVEDLSTEQTARELSIKPETVKTRLHRARKLLRAALVERLAPSFSEIFPFDGQRCVDMAERVLGRL